MQLAFFIRPDDWIVTHDGDPGVLALFQRHYSDRRDTPARPAVGPGEKMVLLTPDGRAVFAWRKFIDDSGQYGVNCAIFRNESRRYLSSDLIVQAMARAWQRWPGQRLYTYVDPKSVASPNPGYCFKQAGWRRCGISKKRQYHILEVFDEDSTPF